MQASSIIGSETSSVCLGQPFSERWISCSQDFAIIHTLTIKIISLTIEPPYKGTPKNHVTLNNNLSNSLKAAYLYSCISFVYSQYCDWIEAVTVATFFTKMCWIEFKIKKVRMSSTADLAAWEKNWRADKLK